MAMRPRRQHGVETKTGAAAPAAARHCHAHARTGIGIAGGPAGAVDIEARRPHCLVAGAMPRASAPQISVSSPGTAGGSSRLRVGRGERPQAPRDADCRCRCSAAREIASAWPLPYAWNKRNWIFQFSCYEDNQDKGNN